MRFPVKLIPGILRARRKRFFADITLSDGSEAIAHCPNPGSMRGNAIAGQKIFLHDYGSDFAKSGRKLRYRWVLVQAEENLICIDTMMTNRIVAEALADRKIPELAIYEEIVPEYSVGDSRLDFFLHNGTELNSCFVEVKSVSMVQDGVAYFPDSVTTRGQKHLQELMALKQQGHRAVILFVLQMPDIARFRPADFIDSEYGRLLREAVAMGVEALVYAIKTSCDALEWDGPRNLELNEITYTGRVQKKISTQARSDFRRSDG